MVAHYYINLEISTWAYPVFTHINLTRGQPLPQTLTVGSLTNPYRYDALTRENTVTENVEKRYAAREDHPTWKTYATMHPASSGIWMKSRKMRQWPSLLLWCHAAHRS